MMQGPLLDRIRGFAHAQQFAPTWLGVFLNPFFLARRQLRKEMKSLSGDINGRILDIGCGRKPYRDLFRADDYVGLEIDSPRSRAHSSADYFYDGRTFPFPDASFDAVLCNQVLEHVFNPEDFLAEIRRVLRPGGLLLLTVPFVWDEHEQPYDYARYSSFGLAHLMKNNGLETIAQRKTLADASLFGQLANAYFFKVFWSRRAALNALLLLFVMAPTTIVGIIFGALLPKNADLYLDNIMLARKSA